MRENILNKILVICCIIIAMGCSSKKLLVVKRPVADSAINATDDKAERLAAVSSSQITFNTFSGRAKTKLDINGNDNDVTLNIRVNRGQKIWISITAIAGIEVARALITPDSIQVLNRIDNVYLNKPFNYIYNYADKQVNFGTLQSLLVGNAIPELINANTTVEFNDNKTTLSGNVKGLLYKILLGADLRVSEMTLQNPETRQSLQVTNSAFTQADDHIVPSEVNITSVSGNNKVLVNLRYTKVEFDKVLEYPFSIPKNYEPAN
ncbi:DUF4292 domain-containing protein [Mucilaginibacter segetis]|uniref:DUF4292 domain-containing protein n=1 Tax=Mucilaginibacter segetis TaxID=2793071 RepID=A0A934PXA9_9SPHI|nr:DUF4292 domain-containing protein [Mucilaginibacter segetis]MBK0381212.1 DUF4292 domain-containing protein [Mucilaginibacter segetis]